eukprot:6183587-Pleurochrysis_carterae.AAC.2
MFLNIYIPCGLITPPPAHAATHARTHATARRPRPAVAQRARLDRCTRPQQLASTRVLDGT